MSTSIAAKKPWRNGLMPSRTLSVFRSRSRARTWSNSRRPLAGSCQNDALTWHAADSAENLRALRLIPDVSLLNDLLAPCHRGDYTVIT